MARAGFFCCVRLCSCRGHIFDGDENRVAQAEIALLRGQPVAAFFGKPVQPAGFHRFLHIMVADGNGFGQASNSISTAASSVAYTFCTTPVSPRK